ncbi:MAG: SDR family oxidoreductase [bacterium]
MTYFVTGGTGFIGQHLIDVLLKRRGKIHVLVRKSSKQKFQSILDKRWSGQQKRIIPVFGDLSKNNLGISAADKKQLKGKIRHFYHLAAIYDLKASASDQIIANVEGTEHAIEAAEVLQSKCFHHVSSIAAAGFYKGTFSEDMFEEAQGLDNPYYRTKHDAEALVRQKCSIPWKVYRPGIVIGHSETGMIDKIDGPYYFFKLIQKMRSMLPPWMPAIGLEGGRINIVPVDFVVKALDYLSHQKGSKECFHLTDPEPYRIGQVLNIFARAGHAPQMSLRIDARMFGFIPSYIRKGIAQLPPVQRVTEAILGDLGIPKEVLSFISYPTKFDSRATQKALEGSGISVPRLESYAPQIWDYWERNLDPDLFVDRSLRGKVEDKIVVVTGASSGIGKATALKMAEAGAKVILVARGVEKLEETLKEIKKSGGKAWFYSCDLSDLVSIDKLITEIHQNHGVPTVLVNNAGRSIRRSISLSFDRFHDFERTMQLNYFGALRMIMGVLPGMTEKKKGHIINISSIGVLTNSPRFSAYVASKSALDAFSRCAASEYADVGVRFTTINMPLVKTPMIAPTKIYDYVPTISPEQAADMVVEAVVKQPQRIATRMGIFAQVLHALAPRVGQIVMNSAFRLFPDSAAAMGKKPQQVHASSEQIAFASIMRGIHW